MQSEECPTYSFSPLLARSLGLEQAIVISRLEALLRGEDEDPRLVWVDGERWLIATYRSLQNREFPFLNLESVQAILKQLNRLDIVVSALFPCVQAEDQFYWHHRLNPAALPKKENHTSEANRAEALEDEEEPGEFPYQSQLEHPHLHFRSRLMDDLPIHQVGRNTGGRLGYKSYP